MVKCKECVNYDTGFGCNSPEGEWGKDDCRSFDPQDIDEDDDGWVQHGEFLIHEEEKRGQREGSTGNPEERTKEETPQETEKDSRRGTSQKFRGSLAGSR